jgi:hypothetical protein
MDLCLLLDRGLDCHGRVLVLVICDDLVRMMICLNVVEKVRVQTPWMEEENAVGHLLVESLQWGIQHWIGSYCWSTFLVSCG